MKGIPKWFPKSHQRTISDPFSKRYNHLNKSCAETLARFSKKQDFKIAQFAELSKFCHSVCFKWNVCPTAFQRAIKEHFLMAFRKELFISPKLATKDWLVFLKSQNWEPHPFWSSQYFLKFFVSIEKVYPSGFQTAINEQFLIPPRREMFIWTKLAPINRRGFQKSKDWVARRFWSSQKLFKRFVSKERYIKVVSKEPSANSFWSLLVEKYSFEQNLRWKSGSFF